MTNVNLTIHLQVLLQIRILFLLRIERRKHLLPLDGPNLLHGLRIPYPSAADNIPNIPRVTDIILQQVKPRREDDEVCEFTPRDGPEAVKETESDCGISRCCANHLR